MEVVAHNTTKFYEDRIGKQDTQLTLIPFLNTMVPLEIRWAWQILGVRIENWGSKYRIGGGVKENHFIIFLSRFFLCFGLPFYCVTCVCPVTQESLHHCHCVCHYIILFNFGSTSDRPLHVHVDTSSFWPTLKYISTDIYFVTSTRCSNNSWNHWLLRKMAGTLNVKKKIVSYLEFGKAARKMSMKSWFSKNLGGGMKYPHMGVWGNSATCNPSTRWFTTLLIISFEIMATRKQTTQVTQ